MHFKFSTGGQRKTSLILFDFQLQFHLATLAWKLLPLIILVFKLRLYL